MLTRARSLFSRVFSLDVHPSSIRLEDVFDNIDEQTSDDNDFDHGVDDNRENSADADENDDEVVSESDNEWAIDSRPSPSTSSKGKGKYERQINEYPTRQTSFDTTKAAVHYSRSHERSRQSRLLSAMQVATSRCNVESMRRLLSNFDIDINHRDQYGMSYLEHAILIGSLDMVDLLIRFGCDLYQGDSHGHSYLYVAIESTSNKSLAIVRLLLESNCSCLRLMDIVSLTSPIQLVHLNSQDFLLLNANLLFILKYHIRRMALNDILNLVIYLITTNLLLCKNDEHYGLSPSSKTSLRRCSHDYVALFVKTLGVKHAMKLEQKLKSIQPLPPSSSLIPLVFNDIQPYLYRIAEFSRQPFELRHLCRLLIRQNLKNVKSSTLASIVSTSQLQDYLMYTPI